MANDKHSTHQIAAVAATAAEQLVFLLGATSTVG
jgi:hypothetical protein